MQLRNIDSVGELLKWRAASTPHENAYGLLTKEDTWAFVSWQEHYERVLTLFGWLNTTGIHRGDLVGVMVGNGYQWELIEKALYLINARVVALDNRLWKGISSSKSHQFDAVITDGHNELSLGLDFSRQDSFELSTWKYHLYEAAREPEKQRQSKQSGVNSTVIRPGERPGDVVTFSSGSTDFPKALSFTQKQLLHACSSIWQVYPHLTHSDQTVSWMPVTSLYQRVFNTLAMLTGTTTYFVETIDRFIELLPRINPSYLIGVPLLYEELRRSIEQTSGRDVRKVLGDSLRFMITGSAKTRHDTLQYFADLDIPLLEGYGMSECIIPVSLSSLSNWRLGSVGNVVSPNAIQISEEGYLRVSSPGLCCENLDGFNHRTGYYETRDIVSLNADGFLTVHGRNGDVLKTIAGKRLLSGEVESKFTSPGYVEECVVVGDKEERLLGMLFMHQPIIEDSCFLTNTACRSIREVNDQLPKTAQINKWFFIPRKLSEERGELTRTGKVKREVLRERLIAFVTNSEGFKNVEKYRWQELEVIWAKSF